MAPVEVFKETPPGRAPAEIDHVKGVAPPVVVQVKGVIAAPTSIAEVGVQLAAVSVGNTVTLMVAEVDACGVDALSVAVTAKLKPPLAVGVPVIAPVAALRARPPGSAPEATDQVIGATPPVTEQVKVVIAKPTSMPLVGTQVAAEIAAATVLLSAMSFVCGVDAESVTRMV